MTERKTENRRCVPQPEDSSEILNKFTVMALLRLGISKIGVETLTRFLEL